MKKGMKSKGWIEPDVLLVDKPKGPTSFDVIRQLRNVLGVRKMGHAGTLDPLASGLMIVGVNTGTKKMTSYLKLPKSYLVTIRLGRSTVTGDEEGEILQEKLPTDVIEGQIEREVMGMMGEHELPVPLYSAIKVDGKALYAYARAGQIPPRIPVKVMGVTSSAFIQAKQEEGFWIIQVQWAVTSGTYIRSLAEELGRRLGYPAMLSGLRRTSIGEYTIDQAVSPDQAKLPAL